LPMNAAFPSVAFWVFSARWVRACPGVAAGLLAWVGWGSVAMPAARGAAEVAATVEYVEVTRTAVDDAFTSTGTVTATQRAALSARTAGLVARVAVDAGAQVEAGDPLLELDPELARLALERAEAGLHSARLQLRESERRREEIERLRANNSVAQTEADARVAEAEVAAAAAAELEIVVQQQRELLARHVVVAPFAGVVARKLTEAGEWVATGTPVLELVGMDELRIDVRVPQERFAMLRDDTPTRIRLAGDDGGGLPARILARVPVGDAGARTFLVRVAPREQDARLLAGSSVQVEFQLRTETAVIAIPRDGLMRRPDGTVNVWVAERAGDRWQATQRRVDVGRRFASTVEIADGLQAGERLIVRGNEALREGQLIAPRATGL